VAQAPRESRSARVDQCAVRRRRVDRRDRMQQTGGPSYCVAVPRMTDPDVVLIIRSVVPSPVNQKSNVSGRLDKLQVRVPPEQSELTWKLPASVSNRVILPFWLDVAVMLKTGRPLLVLMLAVNVPADAKGK